MLKHLKIRTYLKPHQEWNLLYLGLLGTVWFSNCSVHSCIKIIFCKVINLNQIYEKKRRYFWSCSANFCCPLINFFINIFTGVQIHLCTQIGLKNLKFILCPISYHFVGYYIQNNYHKHLRQEKNSLRWLYLKVHCRFWLKKKRKKKRKKKKMKRNYIIPNMN